VIEILEKLKQQELVNIYNVKGTFFITGFISYNIHLTKSRSNKDTSCARARNRVSENKHAKTKVLKKCTE